MKNRKLLILHTECVSLRGGEKYIYEITRRISKHTRVTLCLENISPYWKKRFHECGVPVLKLWKPRFGYWLFLPLTIFINRWRLKHIVDDHTVILATNFPLSFLSVLLSKKTVVFCFEPLSIFYDQERVFAMSLRERFFVTVARLLYQSFDAWAIHRARALATLNTDVASYIKKTYKRTPDIYLPNGVNHRFFVPKKNHSARHHFTILHSTDYTILKGTELLIRAMPRVAQEYPNIRVRISEGTHNPSEKKRYVALVHSLRLDGVVQFIGTIPEKLLPSFYNSGDVYCYLGSPYCGGGSTASLSVIEAQSCGVPVLRSVGGDGEIIHKKTGYYIYNYSEEGIADEILRFIHLPLIKRTGLSAFARKHSVERFSWKKTSRILNGVIQKMQYARQ